MIAVIAVIVMLSAAIGWRGDRPSGLWRRMRWKWLTFSIVMAALAATAASPLDALIALPLTYSFIGTIGFGAFLLGAAARLSIRRKT